MIKEFVLIPDRSLKYTICNSLLELQVLSNRDVVERYNKTVRSGFNGKAHAIETLALHYLMKERFGRSPLKIHNNSILELTTEVKLVGSSLYIKSNVAVK